MAQNVVEYALKVNTGKAEQGLQNISKEAGKASGDIKNLGQNASKELQNLTSESEAAGQSFQGLSKEAGQLGRGTQQLSRAVSMVSPEMGSAMNATAGMAMAVKGLGTVLTSLNPALIGVAVAVGAVVAAYTFFASKSEEAAEAAKKLKDKQDELNESAAKGQIAYEKYTNAMEALERRNQKTADSITNLKAEVQILQGELATEDLTRIKLAQDVAKFEAQIVAQKERELMITEKTAGAVASQIRALENQRNELSKSQQIKLDGLKTERESLRNQQVNLRQQLKIYELAEDTVVTGDAMTGTLQAQSTYFDKNIAYIHEGNEGAVKLYGQTVRQTDEIRRQSAIYEALLKIKRLIFGEEKKLKRSSGGTSKRDQRRREAEKKILDIIKEQVKEMDRLQKVNEKLSKAINQSEKAIKNEGIAILEIQAKRLKEQAAILDGSERQKALEESAALSAKAREQRLKNQTDEIDAQINALKKENELNKLALENAERLVQTAQHQAQQKKHQKKSQQAAIEAQDKLIEAQQTAADSEIKTRQQITNLEKRKANIQLKSIETTGLAQDQANKQAMQGIKSLEKQLISLAGVQPLDPMAAQLESFDAKAEKIRNRIETIRELDPFDAALESLDEIETKLPGLRKELEKKLALEIQVKDLTAPILKLEESLKIISSPEGLTKTLTSKFGELLGRIGGFAKGAGGAIGGAIGGIIGTIAEIGKKTPAEIRAEMMEFAEAFRMGLEILPGILIKVLPEFAVAIAKGIIMAIPILLQELWNLIKEGINAINPFSMRSGGKIPSGRNGLKFTSGTFGGAGLAMLHPNEYVVPSSGQRPQAIDRQIQSMNGSSGMNITINSMMTEYSAVDSLVNKIEQRFKTFGGATSTLFSG